MKTMGLSDDLREETEAVVNRLNAATNLLIDWIAIEQDSADTVLKNTLDFLRPAQLQIDNCQGCTELKEIVNQIDAECLAWRAENKTLEARIEHLATEKNAMEDYIAGISSTPTTAMETGANAENGETPTQAKTDAEKPFEIVPRMMLRDNVDHHFAVIGQMGDDAWRLERVDNSEYSYVTESVIYEFLYPIRAQPEAEKPFEIAIGLPLIHLESNEPWEVSSRCYDDDWYIKRHRDNSRISFTTAQVYEAFRPVESKSE